eukprot:gene26902-35598_t
MQDIYNLGDDSDSDEDEDEEIEVVSSVSKTKSWQPQDIEKLKEQTNELLDPKWKENRNHHLLQKMLELDQPTITVKMVDFLLQDGVCTSLVSFITQVTNSTQPVTRPGPGDEQTEAMKLAYRAVVLMSPENPSDALSAFLAKKASSIAKDIFEIFRYDARGSFYHAYRMLECLLRCYPAEVYEGLCSDGRLSERMSNLLGHIGFSPVCELTIMIIALTPIARSSQLYILGEHNFLSKIVSVIMNPIENCNLNTPSVMADQHSSVAAQFFQELVEKLSLEEAGEILLQCFGQNSAVIDALIDCSLVTISTKGDIGKGVPPVNDTFSRACTRIVCFLLRRAAEHEIMCYLAHNNGTPPTTTFVQNRLYPLRASIVTFVRNRFVDITTALAAFEVKVPRERGAVKYSAYEVQHPFTSLRALIVEMLVLLIESDESVASMLSAEMWKLFVSWAIKYAHNNIYHALFYRLLFAVLRQGQEEPQRVLFRKAKFLGFLVENFLPFSITFSDYLERTASSKVSDGGDADADSYSISSKGSSMKSFKGTPVYDQFVNRLAARGLIMNCANAIRFQISTIENGKQQQGEKSVMNMFISEPKPNDDAVDHDSRFAKSLGFYEDAPWSLNNNPGDGKFFEGGFEERQSFEESDEENSRGSSSALSSITTLEELMDAATLSETVEKAATAVAESSSSSTDLHDQK